MEQTENNIYCKNDTIRSVVVGDTAGVFRNSSNPVGLVIDTISGVIDLDSSATGTYGILYVPDSNSICPADTVKLQLLIQPFIYI